jgi:diazepam-binding inhibitor (GABA receptor modulating acyl-CoA-binding protein)
MSDDIKKRFELSATMVTSLKNKPTDSELLKLYGLYKQATVGKCNINEPSKIYVKDHAKWNNWNKLGNMTKVCAMSTYSDTVMEYIDKYGC